MREKAPPTGRKDLTPHHRSWKYILQQVLFIVAAFYELHFAVTLYLLSHSSLFLQASTGRKQQQKAWDHVTARSKFELPAVMGRHQKPSLEQRSQVRN
jgi:hypothetical protein